MTGGRPDPEWSVYFNFLYPSADDLERMMNRRVVQILADKGDNPAAARMIDHLAYMPNLVAATALQEILLSEGFSVREPSFDDSSVAVNFERMNTIEEVDDVVFSLARLVREMGGEYDGWGCEVTN